MTTTTEKRFHLMRLSPDGKLTLVTGITGQPSIAALEDVIRTKHFREGTNPLVICEVISEVRVETVTNVEILPTETRRKAGRA